VNWKQSHGICQKKFKYIFFSYHGKVENMKKTRLQHKIVLLLTRLKIKIDLR
jgi:hypothetical protein